MDYELIFSSVAISAIVSSIVGPLVSYYFIDSIKSTKEYKKKLISDVRLLLDNSKSFDEIRKSSLWEFINSNLNEKERKAIFPENQTLILTKIGGMACLLGHKEISKDAISSMLLRLEKEWKFI